MNCFMTIVSTLSIFVVFPIIGLSTNYSQVIYDKGLKTLNQSDSVIRVEEDEAGNFLAIYNIEERTVNDIDCSFYENLSGQLKKIDYDNDEITIKGIVIEEKFGKRTYINVDGTNLKNLSNIVYENLSSLLNLDQLLFIDCNVCGSAPFLSAVNIKKKIN